MHKRSHVLLSVVLWSGLEIGAGLGCGQSPHSPPVADASLDATPPVDATGDARADAGPDAEPDAEPSLCGNGRLDPGEYCDRGLENSDTIPDACRSDCRLPRCGDGVADSAEDCDGSDLRGATCVTVGYAAAGTLACTGACEFSTAGCVAECGNGVTEPGEACDDGAGNSDTTPGACRLGCELPSCGDGVVDPGEECDDAGMIAADGCAPGCLLELGWQCLGSPSVCQCATYWSGPGCGQCVVHVAPTSPTGVTDGETWATAFTDLQQGLDAAAAAGPGCEVWLAQGTYLAWRATPSDTFQLRSGVSLYGGFAGTETLRDERDPATFPAVLEGRNPAYPSDRVYHVVTAQSVTDVVLDGVTITGGGATHASDADHQRGGGMRVDDSVLDLGDVHFAENASTSPGSALDVLGGSQVTMTACSAQLHGLWAVVAREQSHLTLSGCQLNDNPGGALHVERATVEVGDCELIGNGASAIVAGDRAEVTVQRSQFVGNTCHSGCALYGYGIYSSVELLDSVFSDNTATFSGGALYVSDGAQQIERCRFEHSTASFGGAIYTSGGSQSIRESEFEQCGATDNGGAINITSWADPVIEGSRFHRCSAENGGAIYQTGNGRAVVSGCEFVANRAISAGSNTGRGGALKLDLGFDISFSDFRLNTASEGGAIYLFGGALVISDSRLAYNSAHEGGALWLRAMSSTVVTTLHRSLFYNNDASSDGGAFWQYDHATESYDSTFIGNEGSLGGVAYVSGAGARFYRSVLSDNRGGALRTIVGGFRLERSVAVGNQGPVLSVANGSAGAYASLIAGNYGGRGVAANAGYHGRIISINSTICYNWATLGAGGLYLYEDATSRLWNTILWGNQAPTNPNLQSTSTGATDYGYSILQGLGDDPARHLLDVDPCFVAGPGAPLVTGTWVHAGHDPVTSQTTLQADTATFPPGQLAGRILAPVVPWTGAPRWLYIADNTSDSIIVWGDYEAAGFDGNTFEVYDFRLCTTSPAIDVGDDTAADLTVEDLDQRPWADIPGIGGFGVLRDLGAYDYAN